MFAVPLDTSIVGRARAKGAVSIQAHNLRDWAPLPHRQVDDAPFGGGPGMVLKPEPLVAAIRALRSPSSHVVAMTPAGERLERGHVVELTACSHLVVLCGRYEGFDQRVLDHYVDRELSIGDYVLSGGELPALVLIDAIVRRLPGVLGDDRSALEDSFEHGLIEAPQYTRPRTFDGLDVPEILLSGHHEAIDAWRQQTAIERTQTRRPDLWEKRQQLLAATAKPR
jgi:tRNA (guanine37-N1)-methyltransferase